MSIALAAELAASHDLFMAPTAASSTFVMARFLLLALVLAAPLLLAWPCDADIPRRR